MGKRKHMKEEEVADDVAQEIFDESTIREEYVEAAAEENDFGKPESKKKRNSAHGEDSTTVNQRYAKGLSFEEASQLLKEKSKCGLKLLVEKRHISLPYHVAAKNETLQAVQHICKMQVNKYRSAIGGVVIAVDADKIKHAFLPLIIDDQLCLHCNVNVPTVVFKPRPQKKYEAVLTSISDKFMTALIFELITVNMPYDRNVEKSLKGVTLETGDLISVVCESIKIKRGMCQMNAVFHKIVEKGHKVKEEPVNEESIEDEKPMKKGIKFASDDEDE